MTKRRRVKCDALEREMVEETKGGWGRGLFRDTSSRGISLKEDSLYKHCYIKVPISSETVVVV